MREEILLSIIIPCYNVEQYVKECVESLLCIKEERIEFIFVDDGSKDSTYRILTSYNDLRMKVYSKTNQGPSSARNLGIKKARGKYIMFVDSDDYIYSKQVEKIFVYLEEKFDMLCFKYTRSCIEDYGKNSLEKIAAARVRRGLLNIDEKFMINLMKQQYQFHGPCVKCYYRKIIVDNNLTFPENLRWGEDICFNLSYMLCINDVYLVPLVIYYYRQNNYSLINSFHINKGKQMDILVREMKKYINTSELTEAFQYFAARQFLYILQEDLCNIYNKDTYKSRKEKAWKYLNVNSYFNKAVSDCSLKKMGKKPAILIWLVRKRQFAILCILFYLKQNTKAKKMN